MKFLNQILRSRYARRGRLPSLSSTHQRYELHGTGDTEGRFILSYCEYAEPPGPEALAKQRQAGQAMTQPPVPVLCRAIEMGFETDHQFVISEFPGDKSLRELLQERQSLTLAEMETLLRVLADACEAAVRHGWPRLTLDASDLYVDTGTGLPRIPTPDVPDYDAAVADLPDSDPYQTIQFHAVDLRKPANPIPKDTRDYVPALAALCCDLLGQPQSLRGGNARYQPVALLTSQQNVLLRRALSGEARAGFPGVRRFIDEFFGVSPLHEPLAATGEGRTPTATASRTEPRSGPPGASAEPASEPSQTSPAPKIPKPPTAPLVVPEAERTHAAALPPALRLRLTPETAEAPAFTLVADEWLLIGRTKADADFTAQFQPRSSVNDALTRRISRTQMRVKPRDSRIAVEEHDPVNPSLHRDTIVGPGTTLDSPALILLAGEYPLELHRTPSDYADRREVVNAPWWNDAIPPQGALVARGKGPGTLPGEAALLLSDIGLGFSQSGRPRLRLDSGHAAAARIHHLAGQFWMETLETGAIQLADGRSPAVHELTLLRDGTRLVIGRHPYVARAFTPGAGDPPRR